MEEPPTEVAATEPAAAPGPSAGDQVQAAPAGTADKAAASTQQGVTEESVGITEYVLGSLPGFGAILKHRCVVHEPYFA